jgi:uncharacterized membrane protein YbaN (DUF454 family)
VIKRHAYLAAGLVSVALAVIGIALPIMPTVPFLVLAAFCFARSNPAWEARLLDHPHYGPSLRAWRERRAIGRPAKLAAVGAMTVGAAVTWFTLGAPWIYVSLAVLAGAGSWIWTRAE